MNYLRIKNYLQSPSTHFGMSLGLIVYLAYAAENNAWLNPFLIGLGLFLSVISPFYAKVSNLIEEKIQFKTAKVTLGRVGRFWVQYIMNLFVFNVLVSGGIVPQDQLNGIGGIVGIACLSTLASQGFQYLALLLANREWGDKNRNVLAAVALNTILTSLATVGLDYARLLFIFTGLSVALFAFGVGVLSDLRSIWFPRRGIGVFLGTFNPFHSTHASIIRQAIADRNLDKVLLHPTVIPKLHLEALKKGEIEIDHYEGGMRVYQKTALADCQVNYFPTGNRFYEYATRIFMIKEALVEMGLEHKVEVLSLPEIYEEKGFYGVLSYIKQSYPNLPVHGIHGSDLGGMWVRHIYDESGWFYPYPVKRIDSISATAIRNGAKGMTSPVVEKVIEHLRLGDKEFLINNKKASNQEGSVHYG